MSLVSDESCAIIYCNWGCVCVREREEVQRSRKLWANPV